MYCLFFAIALAFAIIGYVEKSIKLKKLKRKRKHGFLTRVSSHGGKKVLRRRKQKGRKRMTV